MTETPNRIGGGIALPVPALTCGPHQPLLMATFESALGAASSTTAPVAAAVVKPGAAAHGQRRVYPLRLRSGSDWRLVHPGVADTLPQLSEERADPGDAYYGIDGFPFDSESGQA